MNRPNVKLLRERAERHRLLADPTRLAIVEALSEGPREISELAEVTGVNRNTVRSHLVRLQTAGVLTAEQCPPAGPGRPSHRYRLREPLGTPGSELRLLIEALVAILRRTHGADALSLAEQEGRRLGLQLGRKLAYPSVQQAVGQVMSLLNELSFAPRLRRRADVFEIDLGNCPFGIEHDHRQGDVVCAFHLGLIRGVAEHSSGRLGTVTLLPFHQPEACRVEIEVPSAASGAESQTHLR